MSDYAYSWYIHNTHKHMVLNTLSEPKYLLARPIFYDKVKIFHMFGFNNSIVCCVDTLMCVLYVFMCFFVCDDAFFDIYTTFWNPIKVQKRNSSSRGRFYRKKQPWTKFSSTTQWKSTEKILF